MARIDSQLAFGLAAYAPVAGGSLNYGASWAGILDLGDPNHMLGWAAKKLNVEVDVNANNFSGSATSYDITLQDSATVTTSDFANTSLGVYGIPKAKLLAGVTVIHDPLPMTGGEGQVGGSLDSVPPGPTPLRRYLRIKVTTHGGNGSTSNLLDAFLTPD